ncbi:hypothetical protein FQZ97_1077850 [compost metagenome]
MATTLKPIMIRSTISNYGSYKLIQPDLSGNCFAILNQRIVYQRAALSFAMKRGCEAQLTGIFLGLCLGKA